MTKDKTEHTINKVRRFHEAFGHPVAKELTLATPKLRALRINLIATELCELADALGCSLHIDSGWNNPSVRVDVEQRVRVQSHDLEPQMMSIVETADALGDLDYVVQGANLVFGIPSETVLDEIQSSNMSKLGADCKPIYREDGKILKGPNYRKPDIASVLNNHNTARMLLEVATPAERVSLPRKFMGQGHAGDVPLDRRAEDPKQPSTETSFAPTPEQINAAMDGMQKLREENMRKERERAEIVKKSVRLFARILDQMTEEQFALYVANKAPVIIQPSLPGFNTKDPHE